MLIPENFRTWYTVTHCFFFSVLLFLQQNYSLGLGFRFGLSVDLVLYRLAPQRLNSKTQSKVESGHSAAVEKCFYKMLVILSDHITSIFLNAAFHKSYYILEYYPRYVLPIKNL